MIRWRTDVERVPVKHNPWTCELGTKDPNPPPPPRRMSQREAHIAKNAAAFFGPLPTRKKS